MPVHGAMKNKLVGHQDHLRHKWCPCRRCEFALNLSKGAKCRRTSVLVDQDYSYERSCVELQRLALFISVSALASSSCVMVGVSIVLSASFLYLSLTLYISSTFHSSEPSCSWYSSLPLDLCHFLLFHVRAGVQSQRHHEADRDTLLRATALH